MITLTNNKVNSCVGLCDACGSCAERRDLQLAGASDATRLEAQVRQVVTGVLREVEMYGIDSLKAHKAMIPVGVSARHVHVCQEDLEKLFGPGYSLTKERDLLQPGEFASKEMVTLVGPRGSVYLLEGAIRSNRHIHMGPQDAFRFGVKQNDVVQLRLGGPEGVTFHNVQIRIHETWKLVVHLDTDDANAAGIVCDVSAELIK